MRNHLVRWSVTAGVTLAVVAPLAGSANATVVAPPTARDGRLTQVGPIAEFGFPSWYRDSTGLRLEACTTTDDPLCAVLPDEVPNPDLPVSYPDNFPGEFFYQLADATLTLTDGTKAVIGLNVEGAWANDAVIDGDQMVFGRVRIRFAAAAGRRFRITHPYGIDDLTADDKGVRMTEDVGTTPGAFGQALNSRIGPFLKWDPAVGPAAPAGYTGDPGVDHKVVGSPYGTNFVRIEELDPATGAVLSQVGFTDTFSIQGRYATNAGVDVDQATFTTGPDGNGVVEVYATSEAGQAVEIAANPALGIRGTRLRGQNGHYGRFPVTGPLPTGASVDIVNASDRPVAKKTRKLVDVVQVSKAAYDADAHTLTVAATSSDQDSAPGVLSVTGYGPITGQPFTNVFVPPATVTVTSTSGGAATASLLGSGTGRQAGRHRIDGRDRHVPLGSDLGPGGDPDRRDHRIGLVRGAPAGDVRVHADPDRPGRAADVVPGHGERRRGREADRRGGTGPDDPARPGGDAGRLRVERRRDVQLEAGLRTGRDPRRGHGGEAHLHLPGAGPAGVAGTQRVVRLRQRPGGVRADRDQPERDGHRPGDRAAAGRDVPGRGDGALPDRQQRMADHRHEQPGRRAADHRGAR